MVNESAAYLVCLDFNVGIEEEPAIRIVAGDGCTGKLPLITVVSDNSLVLSLPLQVLSHAFGNKNKGVEKGERLTWSWSRCAGWFFLLPFLKVEYKEPF